MKNNFKVKFYFILLWIFLILSFTSLAIFVLYEANGYRFDKKTWRLEPTGLISIDGLPKLVDVRINGEVMDRALPFKLPKILPGQYEINVSKDGYSSWSKIVQIKGGQAFENKKIILYFSETKIKESDRAITMEALRADHQNQSNPVKIKDNEIWYKEELITRFSETPKSAVLADDREHIVFQINKELRVIELDGANNTKLFDFPSNDQYVYALYSDKIVFIDKDNLFEVEIR